MALQVGDSVYRRMQAEGDRPIRDSEFHLNQDGTGFEQGWGTKGLYFASNAIGNWEVIFAPFGKAG